MKWSQGPWGKLSSFTNTNPKLRYIEVNIKDTWDIRCWSSAEVITHQIIMEIQGYLPSATPPQEIRPYYKGLLTLLTIGFP